MTDTYEIRVPERSLANMIGTTVYRDGEELRGVTDIEIVITHPYTVKAKFTCINVGELTDEELETGERAQHIIEADNCVFTVEDHKGD